MKNPFWQSEWHNVQLKDIKENVMTKNVTPIIGIIGGSGVYDIEGLTDSKWRRINSGFGDPSDELLFGSLNGVEVVFLPRHGRNHQHSPSSINYRANIDCLKKTGISVLISVSAVGSLREDFKPGDFVLVDQFIDRTYKREKSFLGLDLRRKLPFKDEIFEGCFTEHAIEHLHFLECMNLIKEIYRTLKYNSVLRLIVPDLKKYIDNYNGTNVNSSFDVFKIKSEGIWSIAQNYKHKSVWDFELIADLLNKVGFRDISLSQFNKSKNKDLIIDRQDREWNSLYVEAIK